jgi:hypothetical protein
MSNRVVVSVCLLPTAARIELIGSFRRLLEFGGDEEGLEASDISSSGKTRSKEQF